MISMFTIFSMYIMHVCLGSGCNSYQGHVYDSGEFWRVLGCPHVRHHWKCNIVDTFTHHFCTNGHGWTIETSFPYIRKSEWWHSPVQYITFLLILVGSTLCSTSSITTQTFYKVRDKPVLLHIMLHTTTKAWKSSYYSWRLRFSHRFSLKSQRIVEDEQDSNFITWAGNSLIAPEKNQKKCYKLGNVEVTTAQFLMACVWHILWTMG